MKLLKSEDDLNLNKTVLYFYSSSAPKILNLLNNFKDKDVICIDLELFTKLYKRFDIKTLPTMLFIDKGKIIKTSVGVKEIVDNIKNVDIYLLGD